MSRSYWRIVSALVGIGTITAGIGYGLAEQAGYSNRAYQQSAYYAEDAAKQITQSCLRLIRVEQAECFREGAEKYRLDAHDKQREYDDLIAQRNSALWAMIMGIAALIGMALSVAGVILVWTTFRETQKATKAARDAADYARQTLHGERAWMFAENVQTIMINDSKMMRNSVVVDLKDSIGFRVKWENCGRTPAKNVRVFSDYCTFTANPEEAEIVECEKALGTGVCAPGYKNLSSPDVLLTDEECAAFRARQLGVKIISTCYYQDIFTEETRISFFQFFIGHGGGIEVHPDGNRETIHTILDGSQIT